MHWDCSAIDAVFYLSSLRKGLSKRGAEVVLTAILVFSALGIGFASGYGIENGYPVVVGQPRGKHIMSGIQKN